MSENEQSPEDYLLGMLSGDGAPIEELMSAQVEEYLDNKEREAKNLARVRSYIEERIEEIKNDKRLSYPPATVFENAPLALTQSSLKARLDELERIKEILDGGRK